MPADRFGGDPTAVRRLRPTGDERALSMTLAFFGGFVDAFGLLVLFGAFVGHMSGNVVAGLAQFASGIQPQTFERLLAVPAFVAGVVLTSVMIEALHRRGVSGPRTLATGLAVESALLAAFLVGGLLFRHSSQYQPDTWRLYVMTTLGAAAMGVQTASLRSVRGVGVHTTFISGGLTMFFTNLVAWFYARRDGRAAAQRGADQRAGGDAPGGDDTASADARRRAADAVLAMSILGPVLLAFAMGALTGGVLHEPLGFWAVAIPIGGFLAVAAALTWRPRPPAG